MKTCRGNIRLIQASGVDARGGFLAGDRAKNPPQGIFLAGVIGMKNRPKNLITTGEANKMLRVSLSTAMRYFDRGILKGQKTPITNRRYVNRDSVVLLMEKYGIKLDE
jgi:hypothetical protein